MMIKNLVTFVTVTLVTMLSCAVSTLAWARAAVQLTGIVRSFTAKSLIIETGTGETAKTEYMIRREALGKAQSSTIERPGQKVTFLIPMEAIRSVPSRPSATSRTH